MGKKLLKRIAVFGLVVGLSISQAVTSFADDLSPECYIFSVILRSCGISAYNEVGQWLAAYRGYLEATGDQAMLRKLEGYSGLSWGSAANGTDDLYWSVRDWLLKGVMHEGTDSNGNCFYSMPSGPSPLPSSSLGVCGIQGTRFSDVSVPSDVSGYAYVYSDSYAGPASSGRTLYVRRNIYAPAGMEVFGIVTNYVGYSSSGYVVVKFYTPDESAAQGYREVSLRSIAKSYWMDTGAVNGADSAFSATVSSKTVDCRSVMNFPFKVFPGVFDAEAYCKTGVYKDHVYSNSSMALWARGTASGSDHGLLDKEIKSVGDSIKLPASSSAAASSLTALRKPLELGSLTSALSGAGMEISYVAAYKVEHYKRDVSDMDAPVTWIKESEESLTGIAGQPASFTPKSYPYFLYSQELTEPKDAKILGDGSQVVRLYYEPDPDAEYSYSVEYYKDGELFKTVSGAVPMFGDRTVKQCGDFCPEHYLVDREASTALPFEVTQQDAVICVYYEKDPDARLPYTVEYHKDGEVFKTVSGGVPVFGEHIVRECEDFCPQYYLPDAKASTLLPFEVTKEKNVIHVYYKRDLYATFPYTVEYYQDGELFKTIPASVSVFDPLVKSCISYCPRGYVLDTTASTPLPYEVSADGGAVRNYYVRQDTVIPYTVEYYRDGLRMSVFSGNVPSASPVLQSFPSRCPEYYKPDQERSTPMPYTVPEGGGRIKVYYVKDEGAVFPYTVECYKDGKLVETASRTVSVFNPAVKEYGFDCPEGYVVDTSSSTTLPYSVSKDSNVIKYCYVDAGKTLPYTVEYYKNGKEAMTLTGNVLVTSPVVEQCWPYHPDGYILDEESSDTLPFTVTGENNVIRFYYVPDPSDPYASFAGGVSRLVDFVAGFFSKAFFWLFILILLYIFIDRHLVLVKRITSRAMSKEPKSKKKLFTAPKSRFMKGVHANKGASLRSKANMQKGVRPGSLRSKATISDRRWKGGYTKRR